MTPPRERLVSDAQSPCGGAFPKFVEIGSNAGMVDDSTKGEGESDCFEQIYWVGLLLYLVGDSAAVPLMWEGKQIDMDTAIGFDGQFLVGAGVEETIKYLEERGQKEPAEYLRELKASKELDDLSKWEKFRVHYFYPENAK